MLASVMNVTASAPLSSRVAVRGANRARLVRCASPVVVARATTRHRARINLTVRAADAEGAAEETEDDFEARLGALRGKRSKRAVSDVARKEKDFGAPTPSSSASPAGTKKRKGVRDFTTVGDISEPSGKNWGPETILYEGPPARGEIIANVAMSWTVVWIPLTIAAIGRGLWSSYKITDKRVVVISTSPLRMERVDVPLDEIVDIIAVGRGVGLWGDVVITLKNKEKIEMRSLPNFKDVEAHIKKYMGTADPEFAQI